MTISVLVEVEDMRGGMPRDAIHVVGEPGLPIPHLVKNTELGARALL